jgi:hypothetical protein
MHEEPLPYVIAHLHEAILKDPRFTDQAVEIDVVESRIVLRGEVATPERRAGILALVAELLPDAIVVDDLCVTSTAGVPPEAEEL